MTDEQMAGEIQDLVGKLMSLEAEAWQMGQEGKRHYLVNAFAHTRQLLVIAGRLVEPPLPGVPADKVAP